MKQRGLTLVEMLVTLVIMGVVLGGLMGLWTFGFNTTRSSQDTAAGYNIARLEMEKARAIGYMLYPEGAHTTAYDGQGQPTQGEAHFVATTTVHTVPDANGQVNTGCVREVTVEVVAQDTGRTVFTTTSYLTKGGV
jgi:prepilin-type N-terminal cleavage/methylation domain-containing protein